MKRIQLSAHTRARAGKGASRATRLQQQIPSVIYGQNKAPELIGLDYYGFVKLLETPRLKTALFEIDCEGKKETALCKEIQYHVVKKTPIHVDFMRIDEKKPFNMNVPVVIIGQSESPAIKSGSTLTILRRDLPVVGLAKDLVETIEVSVKDLKQGASLHLGEVALPAGLSLQPNTAKFALVSMTAAMAEEAPKPGAVPAAAAAAPAKGAPAAKAADAKAPAKAATKPAAKK